MLSSTCGTSLWVSLAICCEPGESGALGALGKSGALGELASSWFASSEP